MKDDEYPTWVCYDCAVEAGYQPRSNHVSTFHIGICGVCKQEKSVTEPRDFGYPKFKKHE